MHIRSRRCLSARRPRFVLVALLAALSLGSLSAQASGSPNAIPRLAPTPVPTPVPPPRGRTYRPACDTSINQWEPERNYADRHYLNVRQGGITSALMRFDLGDIARGASIESATLNVYSAYRTNQGHLNASIYLVLRDWACEQVTWLQPRKGERWGTPGCNQEGADRAPWPEDARWLDAEGRWFSFDVTYLVREWVMKPEANYGFLVRGGGGVSVQYDIASSEVCGGAYAPQLVIVGDLTAPTPTASPTLTPTFAPTVPKSTLTATPSPSPTPTRSSAR